MATVVNKYKVDMNDPDVVYIGRGSLFGNPFPMKNKSEEERVRVIEAYRNWLWNEIMEDRVSWEDLVNLDGKRLACYCSPKACHGDVLVKAIEWAIRSN